jgi:hypothetical protein
MILDFIGTDKVARIVEAIEPFRVYFVELFTLF